ncbi:MAG: ABC transporter permease [Candidatus Bathyarchaeota archaeon]|jgi:putative ABC transport system permease protein
MKIRDVFSYAFGAIRLRKLRAGLTTLGIVIGIAAIVALLSISQGLQDTITIQLQTGFATDTLIVAPGGGFGTSMGGSMGVIDSGFSLLVNDTQIIDKIEHVSLSTAIIQKACFIKSNKTSFIHNVVGVDFEKYTNIYSTTFKPAMGTLPQIPTNETVVIGTRVSNPWNNETTTFNVGDPVKIIWTNATARPPKNETYTGYVVAILEEIGGLGYTGPSDFNVYIPISQAQSFFGTDECDNIIVKLDSSEETIIENASEAIEAAFSEQVSAISSTAVLQVVSNIFSTIELFLAGIAAISLVVAGIGIMNIMIVSLMERTREIGILKAVGMKSRTVLLTFLSEAVIIGLMGAVIGAGSGWVLAQIVARVFSGGAGFGAGVQPGSQSTAAGGGMAITPVLTPIVFFGALVFGLVVSMVFALYPAWRASRLKPVDALRYE